MLKNNETSFVYLRRIFFVLSIIAAALIQNTPNVMPRFFGASNFILIPLVICIAMFESSYFAQLFGVIAGILWDITSVRADGFYTVFMFVVVSICSLLISTLIRNNLITSILLTGITLIIFSGLQGFMGIFAMGLRDSFFSLIRFYTPSMLYTFLFAPIIYIVIRLVIGKLRNKYPKNVNLDAFK